MSGFCKIDVQGAVGGVSVLNVFWYRSATWVPGVGNPFSDMQEVLDSFDSNVRTEWLAAQQSAYVLQRFVGVGYDDAMIEVPGSLATKTIQLPGALLDNEFDSYALCANITWRCGEQHQISGVGHSKRNRGTTSFGPVASLNVDNTGHFTGTYVSSLLNSVANSLRQSLADLPGWSTLIPIRLHEARTLGIPTGTTYSDILGYQLPTRVTFRRSRLPEL